MVVLTPSIEFSTLDEEELKTRLGPVLSGKSDLEQSEILKGLVTRMEEGTILSYSLVDGSVSGEVKVEVPDEYAQEIEDDPLSEESFLVNTSEEAAADFQEKLEREISSLLGQ